MYNQLCCYRHVLKITCRSVVDMDIVNSLYLDFMVWAAFRHYARVLSQLPDELGVFRSEGSGGRGRSQAVSLSGGLGSSL